MVAEGSYILDFGAGTRLPGLDAVSFGPKMQDIHTSRERLNIASVERTWHYLRCVLEML